MRRLKHGSARNSGALSAAAWRGPLLRWLGLLGLAALGLQLFFALRIGLIWAVDPQSTAFERSEAWQLAASGKSGWSQIWKPYGQISDPLKRAVITSEDDAFAIHDGVDWESIGKAWEKNSKAQAAVTKARTGKPLAGRMTKIVGERTAFGQILVEPERADVHQWKSSLSALAMKASTSPRSSMILDVGLPAPWPAPIRPSM